jgi:hypothetical protein
MLRRPNAPGIYIRFGETRRQHLKFAVDDLCMDSSQTRVIEFLREVHLIAFKEIERLNQVAACSALLASGCSS